MVDVVNRFTYIFIDTIMYQPITYNLTAFAKMSAVSIFVFTVSWLLSVSPFAYVDCTDILFLPFVGIGIIGLQG